MRSARPTCRGFKEIAIYPPVLAFTVAVRSCRRSLFGSIPAFKHAVHVRPPLVGRARRDREPRAQRARSALVVAQVALALVLVVSAGLMFRTFQALRDVDPGFADPRPCKPRGSGLRTRCSATRRNHARAARDSRRDRGDTGRRLGRLYERAADGRRAVHFRRAGRGRRPDARGRESCRRRADSRSSRPVTSRPWARESSRDATSRGPTSTRAAASR